MYQSSHSAEHSLRRARGDRRCAREARRARRGAADRRPPRQCRAQPAPRPAHPRPRRRAAARLSTLKRPWPLDGMPPHHHAPRYPRDLRGYGRNPPHARWPGDARIALQFVLNYEEGGENCVLHGDAGSETVPVGDVQPAGLRGAPPDDGVDLRVRLARRRVAHPARVRARGLPLTVFGVSMALERYPEVTAAFIELGHEIACHGWRWIHYQNLRRSHRARAHARRPSQIIERLTGGAAGRSAGTPAATARTRAAWSPTTAASSTTATTTATTCRSGCRCARATAALAPHLVVPYTLDTNDMRFALPQGFSHGDEFFDVPARRLRRAVRRRRRARRR